jgi:hypothetical protein
MIPVLRESEHLTMETTPASTTLQHLHDPRKNRMKNLFVQ